MSDRPDVSIIIPTRNRRAFLEESLESVSDQTFERWEIIVVDDASEDDTWDWLQGLSDERIHCLRMDRNTGSTITRNAGLHIARGKYCLFLDDDDRLPPHSLATHIDAIEPHGDAIATLGSVARIDASGAPLEGLLRPSRVRRLHQQIWRDVQFWWAFLVGASLFRRSSLESIGGFDESIVFFGDDIDLWLRLGHLGTVVLTPEVILEYRSHTQTRPSDFLEMLDEIHRRFAVGCEADRRSTARKILKARYALEDLRLRSGEAGNVIRILRLAGRVARCPYLATSPLSMTEIVRTIRRDLAMDPWLAPIKRTLGRG